LENTINLHGKFEENAMHIKVYCLNTLKYCLDKFHSASIDYCHFKSNSHLLNGMYGDTDLDILVNRSQRSISSELLSAADFKRFVPMPAVAYPGVEDWIGFDRDTGRLIHLQIHWQLIAGEPDLKGYHLPWEYEILSTRIFNNEYGIFTTSPEMEMLLLLTRICLKHRFRDNLLLIGKKYPKQGLMHEYQWLYERADLAKTIELSGTLLSVQTSAYIEDLLSSKDFDNRKFNVLRKSVKRDLVSYKTYGIVDGTVRRWRRESCRLILTFVSKRMGVLTVGRRIPAAGGLVIALIGADGAGKSTLAKDMTKWLGWKLDVSRIYFGSGEGFPLIIRKVMTWYKAIIYRIFQFRSPKNIDSNLFYHLLTVLYALSLAQAKYIKVRKVYRARNKGMVVICDRYPQDQFAGFNDGPLLSDLNKLGFPWDILANWERHIYKKMLKNIPDLVIKLNVDSEIAMNRKQDTTKDILIKKISAVKDLAFNPVTDVISIATNEKYENVSKEIKTAIWNKI